MNHSEYMEYAQWLIADINKSSGFTICVGGKDEFQNTIPFIYFHGKAMLLDGIPNHRVTAVDESLPVGIYEVYHLEAGKDLHAYVWISSKMLGNDLRSGNRHRGLIVDPDDYEATLYAKRNYNEKL